MMCEICGEEAPYLMVLPSFLFQGGCWGCVWRVIRLNNPTFNAKPNSLIEASEIYLEIKKELSRFRVEKLR